MRIFFNCLKEPAACHVFSLYHAVSFFQGCTTTRTIGTHLACIEHSSIFSQVVLPFVSLICLLVSSMRWLYISPTISDRPVARRREFSLHLFFGFLTFSKLLVGPSTDSDIRLPTPTVQARQLVRQSRLPCNTLGTIVPFLPFIDSLHLQSPVYSKMCTWLYIRFDCGAMFRRPKVWNLCEHLPYGSCICRWSCHDKKFINFDRPCLGMAPQCQICPENLRAEENREHQGKQPASLGPTSSQGANIGRRRVRIVPASNARPQPAAPPGQYVAPGKWSTPSQDLSGVSEFLSRLTHSSVTNVSAAGASNVGVQQQQAAPERGSSNRANSGAIRRHHKRKRATAPPSYQERYMHDISIAPLLSPPPEAEVGRFRPIRLYREDIEEKFLRDCVWGLDRGTLDPSVVRTTN